MNVKDTVAITANYASFSNIVDIWDTLVEFEVDQNDMNKVYCNVLDQNQRDALREYYYDCERNEREL